MKRTVAIIFAVVLAVMLCSCGSSEGTSNRRSAGWTGGAVEESGNIVFSKFNGSFETFTNYDTRQAVISADLKKAVFCDAFGSVKTTEAGSNEVRTLLDAADSDLTAILGVYNDGAAYVTAREKDSFVQFRFYSFLTQSETSFARNIDEMDSNNYLCDLLISASEELRLVYKDNGSIYLYSAADGAKKIGEYRDKVVFHAISKDGNVIVWSEINKDKDTVYCYENGDLNRVCEYKPYISGSADPITKTSAAFNLSDRYYVITNFNSNIVYIKKVGENSVKYELGHEVKITDYFTKNGMFTEDPSEVIDGVYVVANAVYNYHDGGHYLYYLDAEGVISQVSSQKTGYLIENEKLFYLDKYGTKQGGEAILYTAKLNGDSFTDLVKIASKVEDFSVVGDYLYYIAVPHIGTRLPGDTASVYVKKGEEAPVKIPQASSFSFFSDDGAILFFFSDNNTETINGEKITYGNLLSFTYGDTAVKQIDSNVINNSLISGRIARQSVLRSLSPWGNGRYVRAIDPSSFTYRIFKYSSSNKYFYGLKYYNGKEIIEGSKQAIQYIGQ